MKEKRRTLWKAVEGEAFAVKPTNVDLADEEWRRFTGAVVDSSP